MPRRSLTGSWGESATVTVRLAPMHWLALTRLEEAWECSRSEVLRRALLAADAREQERADDDDEEIER